MMHMKATLPLERMTVAEKLRAMEALWADLSRDEAQIESPAWHGDVLHDREARVKSGGESFTDWETAKKQLHDKLT
jgi:broad specificity phosphatase PhoE